MDVHMVRTLCERARTELGAAIMQMIDSDDQIICDRVRKAKTILDTQHLALQGEGEPDTVLDALRALCRELDQYYDVDDGVGNLPADITQAWMKAQDVLKARGHA